MAGGNSSAASPAASKRSVSRHSPSPVLARSVTAGSGGVPEPVQRHTTGSPFATALTSGAALSRFPPPASPNNQSASAATSARYASALAPPRNAQRYHPAAAISARRSARAPAPRRSDSSTTGRARPRRASRAVSATTAALSGDVGV